MAVQALAVAGMNNVAVVHVEQEAKLSLG